MCCLRHPQYRWDDRRIQPRLNHSAGGNSEGETEDTSPSSNTPRDEITPTYGATRSNANPNTCGTTSTDSNEKTKGPGHTGTYVLHSRDRQVSPGVARTTELTQMKYHRTSLNSDVRDYVFSCGCRTLKMSTSHRVAMLPARFLQPWEVLEMDIHDMGARLETGNKHLLVVVDRASKFRFAYPLPNKTAENVAKKRLELLLTSGIPLSLRSDPGTEFTAEVVKHVCKWLNVTIDYGPTDHPRAQGAVERLGGWIHEILMELCKS